MDNKLRCQSCGMPLMKGNFGTFASGADDREYCSMCFKDGAFTEPAMTLQRMLDLSIGHLTGSMGIPQIDAEKLANEYIPNLKRWKK